MYTILGLNDYAFFPSIIGWIIIFVIFIFFKKNCKYNTIVTCGYVLLYVICIYCIDPSFCHYKNGDFVATPTYAELMVNTLTWLTVCGLLLRTEQRSLGRLYFILIALSVLGYFIGLYRVFFDVIGTCFTVLLFRNIIQYKGKSYVFLFFLLLIACIIGYGSTIISWSFIKKDFRPNYLTYCNHKHLLPMDYYICNSIEDTEERFELICEKTKESNSSITFLEDTMAAFSFKGSNVNISWDGDMVSWTNNVGSFTITKKDSLWVGDIIYPPADVVFSFQGNDNNAIIVEGNFEKMKFGVFCAFQQYLKQEIPDLTNQRISLYNNKNEFKLGIQYFENDEYCLYLDDSFLDK